MSDMRLILEGWRQYSSIDVQYDEVVSFILENYYGDVLTEGIRDDIISGLRSLVSKFGKTAVTTALVAGIATGALSVPSAMAAEKELSPGLGGQRPDLPTAAQQMDDAEAKKIIDMSEVGQELKDIFGKDGKISKLLKKKSVDDAPEEPLEATPEPQPEGFTQNAETGDYEFRVAADSYNDRFAEIDAREGLIKNLAEQGLAGLEMSQDGNITSVSGTINGLAVHYDQESSQFVGKWSPERAERAQEISRQMKQMRR